MPTPLVRARNVKGLLESAGALPGQGSEIRAQMGPACVRELEESPGIAWLPFERELDVVRAIDAVLGGPGARAFHRAHFHRAFRGPLFRTLVDGSVALFGLNPGLWRHAIATGWSLVFRDCGRWRFEEHRECAVVLVLEQLPPAAVESPVFVDAVAASLSAMMDVTGFRGGVDRIAFEPRSGEARMLYAWEPRG